MSIAKARGLDWSTYQHSFYLCEAVTTTNLVKTFDILTITTII